MSFYIKSWHAQTVLPMAMFPQKNIHQIHFFRRQKIAVNGMSSLA